MTIILTIFLIGGFLGWLMDSGYRSLEKGKFTVGTLIPGFSLVFGAGAVVLFWVYTHFDIHPFEEIVLGTIAVTLLEFFSGVVSSRVLSRRLWDYEPNPYDLYGHIDLLHSFYWFMLSAVFYLVLSKLSFL